MSSSERILVLADDLTGAAEIAGIVRRYGLDARIIRCLEPIPKPALADQSGVAVVDTDSRGLSPTEAARRLRDLLAPIPAELFTLVYKKTDSVLRGPIPAEIGAVMSWRGTTRAALLAQNPSRGRTVHEGIYRIDGVPLSQTAFAQDPRHPARSSRAVELLGDTCGLQVRSVASRTTDLQAGLSVCDAVDDDDVRAWAARLSRDVLPAGGVDFFARLLEARELRPVPHAALPSLSDSALLIRGTASTLTLVEQQWMERRRFATHAVPAPVLYQPTERAQLSFLVEKTTRSLRSAGRVAVVVEGAVQPSASPEIERRLAELTHRIIRAVPVQHLLLTGGATAAAICRRMGWSTLVVSCELSSGVVECAVQGESSPRLALKPGSYPWPDAWI